jgi:hypothetical protein
LYIVSVESETVTKTEEFKMYDYQYSKGFNVVKLTYEGEFVVLGDDVSDDDILKMVNMEDVSGWEMMDL